MGAETLNASIEQGESFMILTAVPGGCTVAPALVREVCLPEIARIAAQAKKSCGYITLIVNISPAWREVRDALARIEKERLDKQQSIQRAAAN